MQGASLFAAGEILKSLGVIVFIALLARWLQQRQRRRRKGESGDLA